MKQLTPEEQEADALAHSHLNFLLDKLLAYVKRLPQVPATKALVEQIEADRLVPSIEFARRRAEKVRLELGHLSGTRELPQDGDMPLYCGLGLDNMLTLKQARIDKRAEACQELLQALASERGVRIKLTPDSRRFGGAS
jgi:hypothetical protein